MVIALFCSLRPQNGDDQDTQMNKIGRPKRKAILVMVIVCFVFIGIMCLHSGRYPAARHDGSPWIATDSYRQITAGEWLPFRAVVVLLKLDWAEMCHTVGLPAWNDHTSPCPFCFGTPGDFYQASGLSPVASAHPHKSSEDYEVACRRCETIADMPGSVVGQLKTKLIYDRSKKGRRGRILNEDIPAYNLLKNDR